MSTSPVSAYSHYLNFEFLSNPEIIKKIIGIALVVLGGGFAFWKLYSLASRTISKVEPTATQEPEKHPFLNTLLGTKIVDEKEVKVTWASLPVYECAEGELFPTSAKMPYAIMKGTTKNPETGADVDFVALAVECLDDRKADLDATLHALMTEELKSSIIVFYKPKDATEKDWLQWQNRGRIYRPQFFGNQERLMIKSLNKDPISQLQSLFQGDVGIDDDKRPWKMALKPTDMISRSTKAKDVLESLLGRAMGTLPVWKGDSFPKAEEMTEGVVVGIAPHPNVYDREIFPWVPFVAIAVECLSDKEEEVKKLCKKYETREIPAEQLQGFAECRIDPCMSSVIVLYAAHHEIAIWEPWKNEGLEFHPQFFEDKNVIDYPISHFEKHRESFSNLQGIMQGKTGADLNNRLWTRRAP